MNLATAAASFAHLAGIGRPVAATAEEKPDDEAAAAARAEEDEKEKEAQRTANKAATGHAETDDERKDREDAEAAAAATGASDDYDDEDKKDAKAMRSAEGQRVLARCAAIFGHKAAGRAPVVAATLAFNSPLGRFAAIDVLRATSAQIPAPAAAAPAKPGLHGRMAETPLPAIGPDGGKPAPKAGSVDDMASRMMKIYDNVAGGSGRR